MTRRSKRTRVDPFEAPARPRVVRLMTDYGAFPVWWPDGCASPDELPISDDLVAALWSWAATFDQLVGRDFEWPSAEVHDRFVDEGYRLWRRLQTELGPEWTVEFDSGRA